MKLTFLTCKSLGGIDFLITTKWIKNLICPVEGRMSESAYQHFSKFLYNISF